MMLNTMVRHNHNGEELFGGITLKFDDENFETRDWNTCEKSICRSVKTSKAAYKIKLKPWILWHEAIMGKQIHNVFYNEVFEIGAGIDINQRLISKVEENTFKDAEVKVKMLQEQFVINVTAMV